MSTRMFPKRTIRRDVVKVLPGSLPLKTFAENNHVGRGAVRRWIAKRKVVAVKVAGRIYVKFSD